ncbi:preprotein translocase subunit SecE [Candidatus Daviesbacteria bacterium]|nr:preprotein translocase subunit SecE [Candidatus Daviesbacteria bacterium]
MEALIKMKAVTFLKEVRAELEKVVWPTKDETLKLTVIVILVTLGVGFFIGGIDYLLAQLTQLAITK